MTNRGGGVCLARPFDRRSPRPPRRMMNHVVVAAVLSSPETRNYRYRKSHGVCEPALLPPPRRRHPMKNRVVVAGRRNEGSCAPADRPRWTTEVNHDAVGAFCCLLPRMMMYRVDEMTVSATMVC
jgi:hypothetical protein